MKRVFISIIIPQSRSGLQVLQGNAKMYYNYGNLLAEKGNITEAITNYQKAIRYGDIG